MKKYIIKPEFIDYYGPDANAYTVLTEDDVERIAEDWEKPVEEVLEQLIEDDSDKHAWRLLYRFAGNRMTREQINRLISLECGDPEEFFKTDEDYKKAIDDGFVKWDWYYTTVWVDD